MKIEKNSFDESFNNYFNPTIGAKSDNKALEVIILIFKYFSYATGVIPLGFLIAKGIHSLCGRVNKDLPADSAAKKTAEKTQNTASNPLLSTSVKQEEPPESLPAEPSAAPHSSTSQPPSVKEEEKEEPPESLPAGPSAAPHSSTSQPLAREKNEIQPAPNLFELIIKENEGRNNVAIKLKKAKEELKNLEAAKKMGGSSIDESGQLKIEIQNLEKRLGELSEKLIAKCRQNDTPVSKRIEHAIAQNPLAPVSFGSGIPNLGSSCYINSSFQTLFPLLAAGPASGKTAFEKSLFNLFELIQTNKANKESVVAFRQELFALSPVKFPKNDLLNQLDHADVVDEILASLKRNLNLVTTKNKFQYERFTLDAEITDKTTPSFLSLDLSPNQGPASFEELMKNQYHTEIENKEKWRPGGNEPPVKYEQNITVEGPPPVFLPVKLGRIAFDAGTGQKSKITSEVTFKEDKAVDLSHLFKGQQANYHVVSFTVHLHRTNAQTNLPSADGGHYISYRVDESGQWFCYDDDLVYPLTKEDAFQKMSESYVVLLKNTEAEAYEKESDEKSMS